MPDAISMSTPTSSARCGSCGKCGFCSPRTIRLPDEVLADENPSSSKTSGAQLASRIKENVHLEKLARALIEAKIRPEILREDVVADLSSWLRDMLSGPALPLNKELNFVDDVFKSSDFVADAEIFVEAHPGCYAGMIQRNRKDETKRQLYPEVGSRLRVREEVLRNRCMAMVDHFSKTKHVTDAVLKKKATDEFYSFYLETITDRLPSSYNSYTGVMACMGDAKFLKQSEDIVMFSLGLTPDMPAELKVLKHAPPCGHTLAVFLSTVAMCVWSLPSLSSIDEYATIETFTTSIFKEGSFLHLSPSVLGTIRLSFAFLCLVTTREKIRKGAEFKIVRLPGSKLRGGYVQMKGWKTQGFYTSWAWNLLGLSFFLGGVVPMLVVYGREDILHNNPWILRAALIAFEVGAPSALLTSSVVTYALWPQAYRGHGAAGTVGFKGWVPLLQHNANTAMVLLEVMLLGGLPVRLSHAAFAPLFGGLYQVFVWFMANRWASHHGPVYPYFFMDTTLGMKTTIFLVILLSIIAFFFVLFALLDMAMVVIEEGDHGVIPNLCCIAFMSYMLMKFKD